MQGLPQVIGPGFGRAAPFLERLGDLVARMDHAYRQTAGAYGFQCDGCAENCCWTRFYHHTLLEYLYVMQGVGRLTAPRRAAARQRAAGVRRRYAAADRNGDDVRVACPLNEQGLCQIYAHRPMICRLHGIPHELHRPDGRVVFAKGCAEFTRRCAAGPYRPFDRTPFYTEMAALERQLRQALGWRGKVRMTVADMLLRSHRQTRQGPTRDLE